MTTKLPVLLDNLRIASPCRADWDDMRGDERVRFCGRCEKNVYNLSAMTRVEAEALVSAKEGRMCVRFFQRQDGTMLSADCPVGVQRLRLRRRVWAAVSGAVTSAALVFGLFSSRARADLALTDHGKKGGAAANVPAPPPPMVGEIAPVHEVKGKIQITPPQKDPAPPKPKATTGGAKAKVVAPKPEPMMGDISNDQ